MNAKKMFKFWRLNAREDIWHPSKIKECEPPKPVRELQKNFLSGKISFSEYTVLMDKLENNR